MDVSGLKSLYEEQTGKSWSADEGVLWLAENREHLDIYRKIPVLDKTAHITLSDKAGWLSQQRCHVCHSGFPISIIPLRIQPESWQALDSIDKAAFKAAIADRFSRSPHVQPQLGRVCLTFLFVCSANRRIRDLDNMAKLLMDSIKGIVMGDDRAVDHLNLMRMSHEGDEEYVTFRIAPSNLNDHSDVVYPELRHSWAGEEPLRIEDFRKSPHKGSRKSQLKNGDV
jgi:Holliday junction resolvase RusA-like endonuclease